MSTINYGFSLRGTSHELMNKPCQDFHKYEKLDGYTILVCCDGVGSAKFAEKGSKLVGETAIAFCRDNFPYDGNSKAIESMIRMAFNKAMLEVIDLANQEGEDIKSYDTTLDLVVYNGSSVSLGHVGDSGVIGLNAFSGKYEALTASQKGEDSISMIPLRFGNKYWVIKTFKEEYAAVLMATDGMLDSLLSPTILKNQEEKLNISELRKFMDKTFNEIDKDNIEKFQEHLIEVFSDEERLLNVTSDDKTVVVSISEQLTPEILDEDYYKAPDWDAIRNDINSRLYKCSDSKDDEICLRDNESSIDSKEDVFENELGQEEKMKLEEVEVKKNDKPIELKHLKRKAKKIILKGNKLLKK